MGNFLQRSISSEYFSPRVEEMMRSKSQFSSAVEHEIEHSKAHWSEVPGHFKSVEGSGLPDCTEGSGLSDSAERSGLDSYYEEVDRENEKVFAELMNDPQWMQQEFGSFFIERPDWRLGRKIAEGGQAEICEVMNIDGIVDSDFVLKVFKRGSRISDLREQWPHGILQRKVLCVALFGLMLDNGRFAFGMRKCWGDLRKLIDQAMQEKNNQGPPFPYSFNGRTLYAQVFMMIIAYHMNMVHKQGIIHRDLKSSNILIDIDGKELGVVVADFECCIGVLGTGFWRAPEILLAMKNRSTIDFSEKVDVYGYGMLCFEIVTGRLPFEGELEASRASNDLIIEGHRPKLPSDLDVTLKDLIVRCWNPIPNERPSFLEILEVLGMPPDVTLV